MLFADDVVDLMRKKRCDLRKSAVLAGVLRAPHDQLPHVA